MKICKYNLQWNVFTYRKLFLSLNGKTSQQTKHSSLAIAKCSMMSSTDFPEQYRFPRNIQWSDQPQGYTSSVVITWISANCPADNQPLHFPFPGPFLSCLSKDLFTKWLALTQAHATYQATNLLVQGDQTGLLLRKIIYFLFLDIG